VIKVVTGAEMGALDRRARDEFGIPALLLMEHAGLQAALALEARYPRREAPRVLVLAGKGNNGGDGFVVARHLLTRGRAVRVLLAAAREEVQGEARLNLGILERMAGPVPELRVPAELDRAGADLAWSDVVVDALLGTGLSGAARGMVGELIARVNAAGRPVVAVDVPSGLGADGVGPVGQAVRATLTVALGLPKRSLILYPHAEWAGQVLTVDIGLPRSLSEDPSLPVDLPEARDVGRLLPRRAPDAHKGSAGHALVVAGSAGLTGAAALCGEAALRIGAGLVSVAAPASLNDVLEVKLTEVMTAGLPETAERSLALAALTPLLALLEEKRVLALGPGLSTHPETVKLVRELVARCPVPLVLDADGLNAFAGALALLERAGAPLVLTPHPGELARLLGVPIATVQADRIGVARETARRLGATVLLKGARSVVAEPSGAAHITGTGNPGMATAGCGDVLTGVVAGLISQGLAPPAAAMAGAYLHGAAGDLAAERRGAPGMVAGDVLAELAAAARGAREAASGPA
jgi:NAD(P)H-hydrate epimerase